MIITHSLSVPLQPIQTYQFPTRHPPPQPRVFLISHLTLPTRAFPISRTRLQIPMIQTNEIDTYFSN